MTIMYVMMDIFIVIVYNGEEYHLFVIIRHQTSDIRFR